MKFPDWLSERLRQPLPGMNAQKKMMPMGGADRFPIPENTRKSSVLILLFPEKEDVFFLLIRRSIDGSVHSGQMALPGGKIEDFDTSPEAAALREAKEEIHLEGKNITILGRLSPLYIPVSKFEVIPIIGYQNARPQDIFPSEAEVAQILTISLTHHLSRKSIKEVDSSAKNGVKLSVPVYPIKGEQFIWGATAMILSELEALWIEYKSQYYQLPKK